ncbi:glycoside hydrolase family 2 TIM barrel-domain containing protein [Isoptericola sp. NPDC056618]|uniref:glycosyl hydrolase 2 galactose-binding domain-containing protein n=1 Tax=Isoptericola sp. NPDC056618 TaxID=3345878 RepID=UPI0036A85DE1
MRETQSLDGDDWQLREAIGESWRWYVRHATSGDSKRANSVTAAAVDSTSYSAQSPWLPARVPGSVLEDLVRAGEVADPRFGRQSRAAEWVADRWWVLRRRVLVPVLRQDDRVWLELDGCDPGVIVHWDGQEVASTDSLTASADVELGRAGDASVGTGWHDLALVLPPATRTEPQVGRTDRVHVLAPRLGQGWDFTPPMRHQGVWRSVRLQVGRVRLGSPAVLTTAGPATVNVRFDLDADAPVDVEVDLLNADGSLVRRLWEDRADPGPYARTEPGGDVERWWARGQGPQHLYRVRVVVRTDDGESICWERSVGFRDVQFRRNPGSPQGALAYSAVVNGRAVDLVGWNWAPVDTQHGAVRAARVRHLVRMAAASGAQVLRVWGGGLVETEEFYDACDEAGLLVWQEFSQSSSGMQSAPAGDDAFVTHAIAEAERVVPRLASHPSLALWCGGNELQDEQGPLDDDRSPVLSALRDVVSRLDPGRHWLPTSPSGPEFHHRADRIAAAPDDQHDVHGPWEHQGLADHYALANAGTSLAHTEFGVEGMTNRRMLDHTVRAEEQWPPGKDNPAYRHRGEWWNNAPLVRAAFGDRPDDVGTVLRASQHLQATGLQYAVEADRRRRPRCAMVLPWQLNESFPNAWCTAAVDWSGEPKPAFHAVARAFARERVTVRVDRATWPQGTTPTASAWVWSDVGVAAGSIVTLRLRDAWGTILAESSATVADDVMLPRGAAALTLDGLEGRPAVLLWEADWVAPDGHLVDRERQVSSLGPDLAPLLDLAPAVVEPSLVADGDVWTLDLRHVAGPAVVGLALHDGRRADVAGWPELVLDDRPLLPGENRTVTVRWRHDDDAPRSLVVDAWNLAAIRLPEDGGTAR